MSKIQIYSNFIDYLMFINDTFLICSIQFIIFVISKYIVPDIGDFKDVE